MKDLSGITFSIPALKKGYREKEFSPVNVVQEVYRRIKTANGNPTLVPLISPAAGPPAAGVPANETDEPPYSISFWAEAKNDVADVSGPAGCPAFFCVPPDTA